MGNEGERARPPSASDPGRETRTLVTYLAITALLALVMARFAPLIAAGYVGVVVAVVAVSLIRGSRELRRFHPANAEGAAALARGDLNAAHATWSQWAERAKGPIVSAVARHNLAWILMRQGELENAVATLTENEQRNASGLRRTCLACTSALDLTLNHALLGNLEAAETWLAEADRRAQAPSLPSAPAMRAFAVAVLHCRAGRCDEAARMLDERWAEYEGTLTGETVRPLRIVRAFALAAAGPRNVGLAETMLAAARPTYPGEYAFLGKAWPDMATFLAAHELR